MDKGLLSTGARRVSSIDLSQVSVVACNLCSRTPPTNPVITGCGHSFCWRCMSRYLQDQARPCPVCSTVLSNDNNLSPSLHGNRALILYLPTIEDLEQNFDVLDRTRTNSAASGKWGSASFKAPAFRR